MNLVPLDLVTPDRTVYEGPMHLLVARIGDGEIGIMPGHSPLVSPVKPGVVKVTNEEGSMYFAVSGGFIDVLTDHVTVLADTAERGDEVDIERAKSALEKAERRLSESQLESSEREELQRAATRAKNRLQAAQLSGR